MNLQVVSGIIENKRGEVLLAQRPPGKTLAGLWEFPGGKAEKSESLTAALERELKEELELRVQIRKSLGCFPYTYDWGAIDLHVFTVSALNEPRTTVEVLQFRWVKANAISIQELAPADIEPLYKYLASIPGPSVR